MRGLSLGLVLAVAISPANAHAAKRYLDIQAVEQQRSRMDQGVEAVESDQPYSSARLIEAEDPIKKRGILLISVLNAGPEPFVFSPEHVTIATATGLAANVIPYERLVKEQRNRQMWAAIAMGMGAAANSYNASQAGYSYGTVNAYNNYGGRAWGNYTSYNAGQAYAAQSYANMQNQQNMERFQAASRASMEGLKVNFRATTVDPGQAFGGQLTYELPSSLRGSKEPVGLIITVRTGSEVHVFHANVVRR